MDGLSIVSLRRCLEGPEERLLSRPSRPCHLLKKVSIAYGICAKNVRVTARKHILSLCRAGNSSKLSPRSGPEWN